MSTTYPTTPTEPKPVAKTIPLAGIAHNGQTVNAINASRDISETNSGTGFRSLPLGTTYPVFIADVDGKHEPLTTDDRRHQCEHCRDERHSGWHLIWRHYSVGEGVVKGTQYRATLCNGGTWLCGEHVAVAAEEQDTTEHAIIFGVAS